MAGGGHQYKHIFKSLHRYISDIKRTTEVILPIFLSRKTGDYFRIINLHENQIEKNTFFLLLEFDTNNVNFQRFSTPYPEVA